METHLIQPQELFGPIERQEELRECWKRNEGLFDHYSTPNGRPTFSEMFAMCKPGMVNVIANSDIYFDHTIKQASPASRVCYALSRWDIDPTGVPVLWNNHDSQDSFVLYDGPHSFDAPFAQGVPGCDNRLVYLLRQAGFVVLNPSKTIRSYHLHQVQWRSYQIDHTGARLGEASIKRAPGPYAFAKPTEL